MNAQVKADLNMEIKSRDEVRRDTLAHYRNESALAQLEADARNLKLLAGDHRLTAVARAYFVTDDAGRDELAAIAGKLMAAYQARGDE